MPRGYWDWGVNLDAPVTDPSIAGPELAVRLGSPVDFDRTGELLALEDFEHGLGNWGTVEGGAGGSVVLVSDAKRHGDYSVLLTANGGAASYIEMFRAFYLPQISKLGIFLPVSGLTATAIIEVRLRINDTTKATLGGIRYDRATSIVSLLTAADTWTTLATYLPFDPSKATFYPLKCIIDHAELAYGRVLVGNQVYDGSVLTPYDGPATGGPRVSVITRLTTPDADDVICHIDDIILTQNEP